MKFSLAKSMFALEWTHTHVARRKFSLARSMFPMKEVICSSRRLGCGGRWFLAKNSLLRALVTVGSPGVPEPQAVVLRGWQREPPVREDVANASKSQAHGYGVPSAKRLERCPGWKCETESSRAVARRRWQARKLLLTCKKAVRSKSKENKSNEIKNLSTASRRISLAFRKCVTLKKMISVLSMVTGESGSARVPRFKVTSSR